MLLAALPALLVVHCASVHIGDMQQFGEAERQLRSRRLRHGAKWWPFSAVLAAPPKASTPAPAQQASIEDIKDSVVLSAAFGHKTDQLCADAQPQDRARCRQIAGQRLFCALMRRHEAKYDAMLGAAEEKERCKAVDVMVDAAEEAKDAREEDDAKQG